MTMSPSLNVFRSLDSPVDIVTGYGLYGHGLIPCSGKIFLFSTTSGPAEAHPASYLVGTGDCFSWDIAAEA
jgi:hypothetical protein